MAAGTFDNIYIGDFITKTITVTGFGSYTVKWLVAAINYYKYVGDTAVMANHCAMVPETAIFNAPMNATNTTAGGYIGSNMYNSVIPAVATGIRNAFGDAHVIKFRQLLPNAFTSASEGTAKGWAWVDAYCNLMNEVQMYGCRAFSHNVFEVGADKTQFPIFLAKPELCAAYRKYNTWLRNVSDWSPTSTFAFAYSYGDADRNHDASTSGGVRPFFLLK